MGLTKFVKKSMMVTAFAGLMMLPGAALGLDASYETAPVASVAPTVAKANSNIMIMYAKNPMRIPDKAIMSISLTYAEAGGDLSFSIIDVHSGNTIYEREIPKFYKGLCTCSLNDELAYYPLSEESYQEVGGNVFTMEYAMPFSQGWKQRTYLLKARYSYTDQVSGQIKVLNQNQLFTIDEQGIQGRK